MVRFKNKQISNSNKNFLNNKNEFTIGLKDYDFDSERVSSVCSSTHQDDTARVCENDSGADISLADSYRVDDVAVDARRCHYGAHSCRRRIHQSRQLGIFICMIHIWKSFHFHLFFFKKSDDESEFGVFLASAFRLVRHRLAFRSIVLFEVFLK